MSTFDKIATIEYPSADSAGASISFTSIPNTYTHLCLRLSGRTNSTFKTDNVNLTVNGSSANIYNAYIYNNQTSTSGAAGSLGTFAAITNGNGGNANAFGTAEFWFTQYATSNVSKCWLGKSATGNTGAASADNYQFIGGGMWKNTSAINQLTLTCVNGTLWKQYTRATLYGILAA
jgi:hypothetical protein